VTHICTKHLDNTKPLLELGVMKYGNTNFTRPVREYGHPILRTVQNVLNGLNIKSVKTSVLVDVGGKIAQTADYLTKDSPVKTLVVYRPYNCAVATANDRVSVEKQFC